MLDMFRFDSLSFSLLSYLPCVYETECYWTEMQGMGFLAALLLLYMSEEDAFWLLVALLKGAVHAPMEGLYQVRLLFFYFKVIKIYDIKKETPKYTEYNSRNFKKPCLIYFKKLTLKEPDTELEHQPPHPPSPQISQPFFTSISLLHNASLSNPNLHSHFPNKTSLECLKLLIAKPPEGRGAQSLTLSAK